MPFPACSPSRSFCCSHAFVVRLIGVWFHSIEQGRIKLDWIYPETAQPTRRILTTLVWVFAIIVAYPYLPGSETDAFKGVSVFLGLMLTLGSSGLVNQIMSGFMVTYSRALRLGDFVRIGDVEGTVVASRRPLHQDQDTPAGGDHDPQRGRRRTDDHRLLAVCRHRRRVHRHVGDDRLRRAMAAGALAAAACGRANVWSSARAETARVPDGAPGLLRAGTRCGCRLERQESRLVTLHALHANIQDLFNEYGVQIMSPNYMLDPAAPKVVAKNDWFAAPARQD